MGPAGNSYSIAQYKDGRWNYAGRMYSRRYNHSAITLGSTAIIFGGQNMNEKMELLDLNTFEYELIDIPNSPVVETKIGSMFLVPDGYCSAN